MSNEIKYQPFNHFVARSPLLSFNNLEAVLAELQKSEEAFGQVLNNKIILEAIYLGSPILHGELLKFLDGKFTEKKEVERLKDSVLRYLTRMSTRCTPFGLFAGCSVGSIGSETNFIVSDTAKYGRHTRLDMNYLCALSQDIAKIPEVKMVTKFYPNTSMYEYGEQLRYIEYKYLKANRIHSIVSIDNSEYVQAVLAKSKDGAQLKELAELLVDEDISIEEASDFIDELVESQVLVNELEPAITGKEFFEQMLEVLEGITGLEELKEKLKAINNLIIEVDSLKIGDTQEYYNKIINIIKELKTDFEIKYLFQSDMTKPCISDTISSELLQEIHEGITIFNKISPRPSYQTLLSRFAESFYERYETRSVQLLKVLDTEIGIGYRQGSGHEGDINPLIDNLYLPERISNDTEIQWDPIQSFFHKKLLEAIAEKKTCIELKDDDFKGLEAHWDDLPSTISVMCEVFSYQADKKLIYLHSAGGSSAANLLGRFCHTDPVLNDYVLEITQKEEELDPDTILAEIVHLPESRIGNILLRPILRKYEIPYLAKSAVENEFQLPLSDLYISVEGNTVILRSKRLNKKIVPRLSTAHNYSFGAMPVYQFLCDLQTQNLRGGVGFNWSSITNEYSFLPRISYKNLIFSLAHWAIKTADFKIFMDIKDHEVQMLKIKEWRDKLQIPRYTLMPEGDNELFVDFENSISIRTLFSAIKKRSSFPLDEFPYNIDTAIVRNSNGEAFTNEFVFAYYKSVEEKEEKKK